MSRHTHKRAAKRGTKAVWRYLKKHDEGCDFEEAAGDLIADILHALYQRHGSGAVEHALQSSHMHFAAEVVGDE